MQTGRVHWKVKAGTGCTEDWQQNTRALSWSQLSNTLISDFWYESCERTSFCLLFLKKKKKGRKKELHSEITRIPRQSLKGFFFFFKETFRDMADQCETQHSNEEGTRGPCVKFHRRHRIITYTQVVLGTPVSFLTSSKGSCKVAQKETTSLQDN